ncbi:MAG: translation initiation factor IF-2 subunit beta [Halobacteriaceae archaeon]
MDYDSSLDRALDAAPDLGEREGRLSVPDPVAQADGAFTRLTNLAAVAEALDREPDHLHSAIQRDLGTNGELDEGRARYNGSFSASDFGAAVDDYVAEYVTCSECGLPDTRLVVEDRTQMLRCDACGAFRPVAKKSAPTQTKREAVEAGKTYDLEITDTGRKGDGVAEKGGYTVFVSGASEGETVSAYVEDVSGTLAFARRVD